MSYLSDLHVGPGDASRVARPYLAHESFGGAVEAHLSQSECSIEWIMIIIIESGANENAASLYSTNQNGVAVYISRFLYVCDLAAFTFVAYEAFGMMYMQPVDGRCRHREHESGVGLLVKERR